MKNEQQIKSLCRGLYLLTALSLIGIIQNQTANASGILKSYRGSPQEKALDAQIKAYRSSAFKNMQVFGRPQGLRHHLMPRSNRALVKEWIRENPEEFKRLNNQLQKGSAASKTLAEKETLHDRSKEKE